MARKLANYFVKFGFDIAFWVKFTHEKEKNCCHYDGDSFIDKNGNQVTDIANNKYFTKHVGCWDLAKILELTHEMPVVDDSLLGLQLDMCYSVWMDFASETHCFVIITSDRYCYTLSLYGGREKIFVTIYDAAEYDKLWNKYFSTEKKADLVKIFGFDLCREDYTFCDVRIQGCPVQHIDTWKIADWLANNVTGVDQFLQVLAVLS